ncbi:MAG: glycoside hydrolase family 88/105 protein [Spirochaetota bacterium]|jgi:unsaturated rhamnogalacturonyl hydrolase
MKIDDYSTLQLSSLLADTLILQNPEGSLYWNYETGLFLLSIWKLGQALQRDTYISYVLNQLDYLVTDDGKINGYKDDEYNLDQINTGKILLEAYDYSKNEKFIGAAFVLRDQLTNQPRTVSKGFWHKKIYPYQIWLDGLYMYGPFAVKWAIMQNEESLIDDVCNQFLLIYEKALDERTGLLRHAWDESKNQRWADPDTGKSPHVWGRAMGWYIMALADVIDILPENYTERKKLCNILQALLDTLIQYQNPHEKMWYQIIDKGNTEGNYLETSCSSMFCYGYAKSKKLQIQLKVDGYETAKNIFYGISRKYLKIEQDKVISLGGICKVAGLGGNPYRDGSFSYYISEPVVANDFKGTGPYILAGVELSK